MARRGNQRRRRSARRGRRGRIFLAVERALLGAGMSVVAFFIERRLIKAIKKGGVEPAPRTAAEREETQDVLVSDPREGGLTAAPEQIGNQAEG